MICVLLERDLILREYYEEKKLVEIMDCIFISFCFFGRIGVKSYMGFWRCVCIIVNFF